MLNALKLRLQQLAADPQDEFSRAIRAAAGPRAAVLYQKPLRSMVLALPAGAFQLNRWATAASMPPRSLRVQKFALAYLFCPVDFIPDGTGGLFGYLDDAYMVLSACQTSRAELEARGPVMRVVDRRLLDETPSWLSSARELLPKETAAMDTLLADVAAGLSVDEALKVSYSAGAARSGGRR